MAIRAVVFDIGGVLEITPEMDFDQRWEARLGLPAGEIGRRLADIWLGGSVGTVTERVVRQAVGDRLGLAPDQVDALLADMWEQYVGVGNDELIDYAGRLRPRYRTGILSNSFVGAREREQDRYGFAELVDDIVYSHEVGLSKPDPRIYRLTADRLGVRLDEVVLVDDAEPNIIGARAAGMHAIWFRDNAQVLAELTAILPA
ncbi:MAG TPA: HAD family phosphatase [Pseudonocardiaceae bacterium]|nr:HAD family phosphatase [Pseudonocardiaceae bacterium]